MSDETANPDSRPYGQHLTTGPAQDPPTATNAMQSMAESLRAIRQPRPDAELFKAVCPTHLPEEAVLIRDLNHTTAATRAINEVRKLALRTPYMQEPKGRAFMTKVYAILEHLETLPQ